MHPHDGVSPLAPGELRCRLVMDMINRPHQTELLKMAAQKSIAILPGIEMLIAQGVAQWEIWFGKRGPEAPMRRAVLAALRSEEHSRQRR
jgi:shikimate 5-dehydrogenase